MTDLSCLLAVKAQAHSESQNEHNIKNFLVQNTV